MIAYKETVHASCYESLSVQWFRRRTKLSRFLLCSFLSYFCRGQALDASWLIPHFYPNGKYLIVEITDKVSMPSRAYTSFLQGRTASRRRFCSWCQCPLGLIPHFYNCAAYRNAEHFIKCQCPLGLIPHFYVEFKFPKVGRGRVSMPSRAYTSFLQ